jgi:hypothetical protein
LLVQAEHFARMPAASSTTATCSLAAPFD